MITNMMKALLNSNYHLYTDEEIYNGGGIDMNNSSICKRLSVEETNKIFTEHPKIYPFLCEDIYKYIPIDGIYFKCIYESIDSQCHYIPIDVIYDTNNVFVAIRFLERKFDGMPFECLVPLDKFLSNNVYNPYTKVFFNLCVIGNVPIIGHELDFYCWLESIARSYNLYNITFNPLLSATFNCFEGFVYFNDQLKPLDKITNPSTNILYRKLHYPQLSINTKDHYTIYNIEKMLCDNTIVGDLYSINEENLKYRLYGLTDK